MVEKISSLISVNTQATLTRGVHLSCYGDADPDRIRENERLASGYIFSSGAASGNLRSAVDIFERVRDALNTSGTHNVFSIIAQYGHGKSHFALVLANYFGRPPDDPVLIKIVAQIEACTNSNTAYLFSAFKKEAQKPQLVVRLSGQDVRNLRQGFMQALRRALDENAQSRDYQIGAVSLSAAKWLRSLSGEKRQQAEKILGEDYQADLSALISDLEAFDSTKELVTRDLSVRLNGVAADFGADLNLREVINKVIADLCVGADSPYHKMVILFDELGMYAERWCYNRMEAGDLAPQQILEACDSNKGRMCMVAFIQREMPEIARGYDLVRDEFRKWSERFPPETTLRLESSLEQVIKGLLTKKRPEWETFARDQMPRLDRATTAAWQILPSYQANQDRWTQSNFTSIVGVGSFPLHPITTGLLCNLKFTQGARTIIEVVTSAVQDKGEQPALLATGDLNFVLPIFLVDEFAVNFEGQENRYDAYKHAQGKLGANVSDSLYQVLKALFLFEVGRLKRYDSQPHAQVLAQLCGLREEETLAALKELAEEHDVIRFSQARREYEFTGLGASRSEIRQQLIAKTAGQHIANLATKLDSLNLLSTVQLPDTEAVKFKSDHGILSGREWHLAARLMNAASLSADAVRKVYEAVRVQGDARGVVIYVVSSDSSELEVAQERATITLDELRVGENYLPVVLAIPSVPINVDQELLIHDALKGFSSPQQSYYGESYNEAVKDSERRLNDAFTAYFRYEGMRYSVARSVSATFRGNDSHHLDQISSRLFAQAFPFRVPATSQLMNVNSAPGNSKVADVARYLLKNDGDFGILDTPAKNLAASLHEGQDKWGVLTARNRLQEPKDTQVARSWKELDGAVLEDRLIQFALLNERLRGMPFGHDDYTLTLLYAAWVGFNKTELSFLGALEGRNAPSQPLSISEFQDKIKKAKEFIRWLSDGNVQIQRPGKLHKRKAGDYLKQLETVTEYEKAVKLVDKFDEIVALLTDDDLKEKVLAKTRQMGAEIRLIHEHNKRLKDLGVLIEKTHVVKELLAIQDGLPAPPETLLIYDENPHIATKKSLNARIESEVAKQTQQPLKTREQYEGVKDKLRDMKDALRRSGRQDLEQLCASALERIDAEYEGLKTKEREVAVIGDVERFSANEAGLAANQKQELLIEELLNTKLEAASENTRTRVERNLQQVKRRISALEQWIVNLPQDVEDATELTTVRRLRDEVIKRERDYVDTPKRETLNAQRELLEQKERALLEEATERATRHARVQAYMSAVENHARRAEEAKTFEAAIQNVSEIRSGSPPEDAILSDEEQLQVNEAIGRGVARASVLIRDLLRAPNFPKEQEFLSQQFKLEQAIKAVAGFADAPGDWQSSLNEALRVLTHALDQWRAIRSQDIANSIVDDFGKLATVKDRADCLLRLAEVCKAEGLSAEYVEKLIKTLKLVGGSNA